jgi:hypothetical protein
VPLVSVLGLFWLDFPSLLWPVVLLLTGLTTSH